MSASRRTNRWQFVVVALTLSTWTTPAFCGWKNITASDGLASNSVFSLLEDHDGNLWFRTFGGLSRYDGVSWKTFTRADGLASDTVTCVFEDREGNLWFGTGRGVTKCDGKHCTTFTVDSGLASDAIQGIVQDRMGNLWFRHDLFSGVSRYDGTNWTRFGSDSLGASTILSMLADRSGNVWFGTQGGGISRYDGSHWRVYGFADGVETPIVRYIFEDSANHIWISYGNSGGGVARFDGTWRTFKAIRDFKSSGLVTQVAEDGAGNIWICGGTNGVSRFDGDTWKSFNTDSGLSSYQIDSMLKDRWGNMWFASRQGGGLSRFDGVNWRRFTSSDGLGSNYVTSLLGNDSSGNLWIATFSSGITRYDSSYWRNFTTADGLVSNSTWSMLEDRKGQLWTSPLSGFGGCGLNRYNGVSWKSFSVADGLGTDCVLPVLADRSGSLWVASELGDLYRYDGTAWSPFLPDSSLGTAVAGILEDASGDLWFGTHGRGVGRYDGVSWRIFTSDSGLGTNDVGPMFQDRQGSIWFKTDHEEGGVHTPGLSRYDGAAWKNFPISAYGALEDSLGRVWFNSGQGITYYDGSMHTFTEANGLPNNFVPCMAADGSGNIWAGFGNGALGAMQFDGSMWNPVPELAGQTIFCMLRDHAGNLWFGSGAGVSRYDGTRWQTFSSADGLGGSRVLSMLEDRAGSIWFNTWDAGVFGRGVTRYDPDRVPPQTVFMTAPPLLTSSRDQSASFAAFGESERIEFSVKFDGLPLGDSWSPRSTWSVQNLSDGKHTLEVRARDFLNNVDPTPAQITIEVAGTPPSPLLSLPPSGQAIRGSVAIVGVAEAKRFRSCRLEAHFLGSASWDSLLESTTPVHNDTLALWNTDRFADGGYDLRLSVTDSLGLVGVVQIAVLVDNHAPFVDVTTPSRVAAAAGGDVFTTNSEAHLYFPPHAFARDALVTIAALPDSTVPDTLTPGAVRVRSGYSISWSGAELTKRARLEFSTAGISSPPGTLVLYGSTDGTKWSRLGGTVEKDAERVSLTITQPGRYALYSESVPAPPGGGGLSSIAFTPRVFSPTGTFADTQVGISFTLGRAAPVTVRVYSRSGRLVREIVASQTMNAGANLVRWDGRDRNGGYATDGLYLVTVEALGHTERNALAVVK